MFFLTNKISILVNTEFMFHLDEDCLVHSFEQERDVVRRHTYTGLLRTGEAVQTFVLHYRLLTQLEDSWLQENGSQFPTCQISRMTLLTVCSCVRFLMLLNFSFKTLVADIL
jgi:hypothetical protein